jgi:hypothetical protein
MAALWVTVDIARVVKETPDQGGLAVIDTTGRREAQQIFGSLGRKLLLDLGVDVIRERHDGKFCGALVSSEHQK